MTTNLVDPLFDAISYVLGEEDSRMTGVVTRGPDGRTRFGISEASNPWATAIGFYEMPYSQALGVAQACLAINYGEPLRIRDMITVREVKRKVLSLGVNINPHHSAWWLQEALDVPADGVIGVNTLAKLRIADSQKVLDSMRAQAVGYYEELVKLKPQYQDDLDGWLNRARA